MLAAEVLCRSENHLGAGRLLLEKAQRLDLAIVQFESGWQRRPAGNSIQCGIELARRHAASGALEEFRKLLKEADAIFEAPGYPFDGYFYNELVRLVDEESHELFAEEVRDHALLSTARSFTRGVDSRRTGSAMVSKLLGRSKLWPSAVVSDADFAVSAAAARWFPDASVQHEAPSGHSLQIGRGSVTAACQASVSGEVFLGFENGLVCVFQPERELVFELPAKDGTVAALAVDPQGQTLAAL